MKPKRPQFMRMTASREENPPLREINCPAYRDCLTEAAFKNFCLDCSQCAAVDMNADQPPRMHKADKKTTCLSLSS
jgi:hypothetical protein